MSEESCNWELITYDLIADDGGYSVNDMFATGRVYEIDEWEQDIAVLATLRDAGYRVDDDNEMDYDVDGDEHVLLINYEGCPLVEFRRTEARATEGGLQ